jgi:16S rRNA (cytosine1402-N4)-methyltransferase
LGGCGHALAIAKALEGRVGIIGFDRDPEAIARAKESLDGKAEQVILMNEDFRRLDTALAKHGIEQVDMILLDLGISSDELDHSGRGFTFQKDEPLLMTMGDPSAHPFTAKDIVNGWEEEDIANVIFGYGEERYARRIAKALVLYRDKKKIETSMELAEVVKSAVPPPYRRGKIHPATKTFQALRIAVNDELNALKEGLAKGYAKLAPGGRMAVISFHSLEDRIVKEFYKEQAGSDGRILTKKPVTASPQEIAENPRSRSAKLRVIEK